MPPRETPSEEKKPTLLVITGWAHGEEAVLPLADALAAEYDVRILTGARVLSDGFIPPTDYIITGSMGGLLALELLPGSCRKLVLISSTAKFCRDEDYACGTHVKILSRMIRQLQREPETVLEEFFRNVHHPDVCHTFECVTEPLDSLVRGLEYLRDSDVRDRISGIGIPVLLLHGMEDRIIPVAAAEWLNLHLPDSRIMLLENAGHALLAHQFDEAVAALSRFLQS